MKRKIIFIILSIFLLLSLTYYAVINISNRYKKHYNFYKKYSLAITENTGFELSNSINHQIKLADTLSEYLENYSVLSNKVKKEINRDLAFFGSKSLNICILNKKNEFEYCNKSTINVILHKKRHTAVFKNIGDKDFVNGFIVKEFKEKEKGTEFLLILDKIIYKKNYNGYIALILNLTKMLENEISGMPLVRENIDYSIYAANGSLILSTKHPILNELQTTQKLPHKGYTFPFKKILQKKSGFLTLTSKGNNSKILTYSTISFLNKNWILFIRGHNEALANLDEELMQYLTLLFFLFVLSIVAVIVFYNKSKRLKIKILEEEKLKRTKDEYNHKLKISEKRYRLLSEIMSDFAYSLKIDDNDFSVEWITEACEQITGYSADEFINKRKNVLYELVLPEEKKILISYTKEVLKNIPKDKIFRIKRKDGKIVWVEDHRYPYFDKKEGRITHIHGAVKDVTEKQLLYNNLLIFKNAVENSFEAIFMTDITGKITYVNNAFTKLYGYTSDEVMGKTPGEFLFTGLVDEDLYKKYITNVFNNKSVNYELINKTKNGKIVYIRSLVNPIFNYENEQTGFIAKQLDITEEKKITQELINAKEKAEESARVKENFFANMSHELRTPLVGIIGFSEILRGEIENEEFKDYSDLIYFSSLRLKRTLNTILDFSETVGEKLKIQNKVVDVNKLVRSEYENFKTEAKLKQLDYRLNLLEEPLTIISDNRLLSMILNHLIDNAMKYTDQGSVEIDVKKTKEDKSEFLYFVVKDSGKGIDKKRQKIIWEEFRQESEGLSRNYEGVGLGLTIVNKFTGLLKGNVELKSEVGKGSS
ncbi:MAG TPA: PAS domain-containing sensor histidine kinase, partial [Ignavibacteria bacterium]|nr:PAS domain-containing sensor histidine kinase [Ignavibacteria bacterium]